VCKCTVVCLCVCNVCVFEFVCCCGLLYTKTDCVSKQDFQESRLCPGMRQGGCTPDALILCSKLMGGKKHAAANNAGESTFCREKKYACTTHTHTHIAHTHIAHKQMYVHTRTHVHTLQTLTCAHSHSYYRHTHAHSHNARAHMRTYTHSQNTRHTSLLQKFNPSFPYNVPLSP
jgi:hypothetical protein